MRRWPAPVEKKGALVDRAGKAIASTFHVRGEALQGLLVDGEDALLGALAHAAHHAPLKVDVLDVQRHELGDPHAGRVEQLEESFVADGLGGPAAAPGLGEDEVDLFPRQHLGKGPADLRRGELLGGIFLNRALVNQEAEEGLERRNLAGDGRRGVAAVAEGDDVVGEQRRG